MNFLQLNELQEMKRCLAYWSSRSYIDYFKSTFGLIVNVTFIYDLELIEMNEINWIAFTGNFYGYDSYTKVASGSVLDTSAQP